MNILLIDNGSLHIGDIQQALLGHKITVQKYHPDITFELGEKDLIVLSGGSVKEVQDVVDGRLWYETELQLIRDCPLPIVGLCLGLELVVVALGGKLATLGHEVKGILPIRFTREGRELSGMAAAAVYKAHCFAVPAVDESIFQVLARSEHGVELLRHKKLPIIATQFHPEVSGGSIDPKDFFQLLLPSESSVPLQQAQRTSIT